MAAEVLTKHDLNILQKIQTPKPIKSFLIVGQDLPRDPHLLDDSIYQEVALQERESIARVLDLERQEEKSLTHPSAEMVARYQEAIKIFNGIIEKHPSYASVYNNRAQALRRLFGDTILLAASKGDISQIEDNYNNEKALVDAAERILSDFSQCIALLSPATPWTPISQQACNTLAQAHMQRGALYYATSKRWMENPQLKVTIGEGWSEHGWTAEDFEDAASSEFMLAGRYGNQMGQVLAVQANPMAKLCGQVMKKVLKNNVT